MNNVFRSTPEPISSKEEPKRSMRQNRSLKGTLIATSRTTKLNYIIRVVNHLAMVGVAPLHKVVNPSSCKSLVNFG